MPPMLEIPLRLVTVGPLGCGDEKAEDQCGQSANHTQAEFDDIPRLAAEMVLGQAPGNHHRGQRADQDTPEYHARDC